MIKGSKFVLDDYPNFFENILVQFQHLPMDPSGDARLKTLSQSFTNEEFTGQAIILREGSYCLMRIKGDCID